MASVRAAFGMALLTLTASAQDVSIPVKLFESKCTLSGPKTRFSEADLTKIHEMSPERILGFETAEQASAIALRLEKAKAPNPELDRYLVQARDYSTGVAKFLQSAATLRTAQNRDEFVETLGSKLTNRKKNSLRDLAGRVLAGDENEVLLATYGDIVGASPDEEFHRAIRRMKIRYNCVFDRGQ